MVEIRNSPPRMAFECILAMAGASCDPAEDASAAADAPPEAEAQAVDELPPRRGFCGRTEDACGGASNATLALARRDGITGCRFARIERIAGVRYRVEQSCRGRDGGREDAYTYEYRVLAGDR